MEMSEEMFIIMMNKILSLQSDLIKTEVQLQRLQAGCVDVTEMKKNNRVILECLRAFMVDSSKIKGIKLLRTCAKAAGEDFGLPEMKREFERSRLWIKFLDEEQEWHGE